MWNPLYDCWRFYRPWSLDAPSTPRHPLVEERAIDLLEPAYARRRACARWSWAIPDRAAIELLVGLGPLIEVGAGTGYWSCLVNEAGGQSIATDERPPREREGEYQPPPPDWKCPRARGDWNPYHHEVRQWTNVVEMEAAEAALAHPDRTLMLCWPPMTSMAHAALEAYRDAGGEKVVYVGEGHGGCTADASFLEAIGNFGWCEPCDDFEPCEHRDAEQLARVTEIHPIPQWDGINDYLYVMEIVR